MFYGLLDVGWDVSVEGTAQISQEGTAVDPHRRIHQNRLQKYKIICGYRKFNRISHLQFKQLTIDIFGFGGSNLQFCIILRHATLSTDLRLTF